ncbi:uncharacterized protein FIESC28_09393 [Fusarium coffeatum]|uniref:F-box domain-containing protein n=1 Tax=Fusarium coffeatum TaxID=231269 RepID=A0A366R282_9HYPO|nr:uncharacterized protein FIESC28_09393 [Fusarium coffeatum]RBR10618.1 hypothetical protein FIESC28_09393 [Fusarium coffeatum]
MVHLIARLPNELLREICLFASTYDRFCPLRDLALVNKQIRQVAFPLLVRHWERDSSFQQPHLGLLALHLLRYPEHRSQVKTLNFMSPSTRKTNPRRQTLYDQSPVRLRPESLAELARAAQEALPNLVQSSNWIGTIQIGGFHAVAVLVMAWATRVTDVAMELPRPYVDGQMSGSHGMMMKFFYGAVQKVSTSGMPLAEVQRLEIETWERESRLDGVVAFPLSVFQLPKLKKFHIKHLEMTGSQDFPIPRGCSTVEELFLDCSKVTGAALRKLLATCSRLRVLHYVWFSVVQGAQRRAIRDALIEEPGSLEELRLDLKSYLSLNSFFILCFAAADNGMVIEKSFKSLSHLRKLTLDLEDLPPRIEDSRKFMPDLLTSQLPASLEELTLTWGNRQMNCLEERLIALRGPDFWLSVVVVIKTLLEEAGPGCKFNKLRYLDVTQILVGSKEMENVVELGRSKGVNVLEYTK